MKLRITSAKITGNPGPLGWAQVHEFKPEDEEKLAKRGHLFAVIAVVNKEGEGNPVTAGRELLSRFHEEYYGKLETSTFEALKNAVKKVIEEFSETWGNIEIAAISVLDEVIYSVAAGGGQINIYREGNLAKILESLKEGVVAASGYSKNKDTLILGTRPFFTTLPAGVLKASLEGPDFQASIESLAPNVHSSPDSGSIAAVFVKFEEANDLSVGLGISSKSVLLAGRMGNKLTEGLKGLMGKISKGIERRIPERKIFVKEEKKTTFSVGAILLVILLISIGFGIKEKERKRLKSRYEGRLIEAKANFEEANKLLTVDAKRARELYGQSLEEVNRLLSENISDKELSALEKNLKENEKEILGVYRPEAGLFMDLSLLSSGFKSDQIVSSGKTIYVFDKAGKKVAAIAVGTKKTQIVAGAEALGEITQIAAYEETIYGLGPDGVYKIGEKKEKVIDKSWEGDVFLAVYAGNLYLLDKQASEIWRYPGVEGKFSAKQNWLAPGITLNFSKVTDIILDGNVWLLFEPFKITKLSLGSPQRFIPSGIFPELTKAEAVYSNEELKYLYVLDKEGKRVVVLDKNGDYQAQYVSEKINEAINLVVSETEKQIILLTGDKLYSIELAN